MWRYVTDKNRMEKFPADMVDKEEPQAGKRGAKREGGGEAARGREKFQVEREEVEGEAHRT